VAGRPSTGPLVNRDTRGFIKILADGSIGRIMGITAVGKEAGELAAAGGTSGKPA